MGANLYYRRYIEKLIAVNPTKITISRIVVTDDGYGGETQETVTVGPLTVGLYNKRVLRERVEDGGAVAGSYMSRSTKLLALSDADIQEGDEFAHAGKVWRVAFVQDYLGVCLQAELEVVK